VGNFCDCSQNSYSSTSHVRCVNAVYRSFINKWTTNVALHPTQRNYYNICNLH